MSTPTLAEQIATVNAYAAVMDQALPPNDALRTAALAILCTVRQWPVVRRLAEDQAVLQSPDGTLVLHVRAGAVNYLSVYAR